MGGAALLSRARSRAVRESPTANAIAPKTTLAVVQTIRRVSKPGRITAGRDYDTSSTETTLLTPGSSMVTP